MKMILKVIIVYWWGTLFQVAIKVIDTRKIKEEYVRQNLHREAKIMAQLRHPNIIRLYETLKVSYVL